MVGVVLQISFFVILIEAMKFSRSNLVAFELAAGAYMDYRDPCNEYADPRDLQRQPGNHWPSLYVENFHKQS